MPGMIGRHDMKRVSFCDGWLFRAEDGREESVMLPHDAMIGGKRNASAPSGSAQGFYEGSSYVYEKTFTLPKEWEGQPVKLQFEGVYKNALVYVNDALVGGAPYGYIPFWIDCGILPSGENTVRVTCDNASQPDSRWYSGAGIYRPVWAWIGSGITEEDVRITTLSIDPAAVRVEVSGPGADEAAEGKVFLAEIMDAGRVIAYGELARRADGSYATEIAVPDAKLWSDTSPYLYTCRIGDVSIRFGIRQITWSSKGLFVNGRNTLLRGGCIHADCGIAGSAAYTEAEARRARLLKEAGYNAIRSAHNPASSAFLAAADEMGLYVMDETWDMWYNHKNRYDYASQWMENHEQDIRSMVARDYNHPSVIMYSIGNEVSEPAREKGIQYTKDMVSLFHSLDSTRPVTGGFNLMIISNASKGKDMYDTETGERDESAEKKASSMNSTMFNMITSMVGTFMNKTANSSKADKATSPCLDELDMCGYNYASGRYPKEGKCHPDRLIFGSETFPQDIARNWEMVKKYPYLCGDFMWTAWDYIGEAGLGAWAYTPDGRGFSKPYPWLLADSGAMDILGDPNGELFQAQAVWGLLKDPAIAVQPVNHPGITPAKGSWRGTNSIPSWSWKGCEGNKAVIEVYSDAYVIELSLNGRRIGKKKAKGCKAVFKTKYAPGVLTAVSYDAAGSKTGESSLVSAKDAGVCISLENPDMPVHEGDVLYIDVTISDRDGVTESAADRSLSVSVEGGTLLGYGSANPRTEERFTSGTYTTYYGRSLAIVRAGKPGTMLIHIASGTEPFPTPAELAITIF